MIPGPPSVAEQDTDAERPALEWERELCQDESAMERCLYAIKLKILYSLHGRV